MSDPVYDRPDNYSATLVNASTAGSSTGEAWARPGSIWKYWARVVGTGAVTATVTIQVSDDGTNWETFGTMTLSGTTSATDTVGDNAPWRFHRANTASVTGTGAAVTVLGEGV